MSDGLNKVILIGHLGSDPVFKVTPGNRNVAEFSLATTESWRGDDGNRHQNTEWHKIIVWGNAALAVRDNLSKGRQVYVEGKIRTRKWTDKEGNDRYTTEIIASKVLFLGSRQTSSDGGFNNSYNNQNYNAPSQDFSSNSPSESVDDKDDLPF